MTVEEIETEISKLSPEDRLRLNAHLIADKVDEVKTDWKGALARACVTGAKILLENAGKAIGAGVGIGGVLAETFTLSSCTVARSQTRCAPGTPSRLSMLESKRPCARRWTK